MASFGAFLVGPTLLSDFPESGFVRRRGKTADARHFRHAKLGAYRDHQARMRIDGKRTFYRNSLVAKALCQFMFQLLLGRPADLICRLPQISARNKNNLFDGHTRKWNRHLQSLPFDTLKVLR